MSLRKIWGGLLYLALFLILIPVHMDVRAEGLLSLSTGEFLSSDLISTQAEVARERPRPGSNRPAPPSPAPAKAVVIPEPPPFPVKDDDQAMMWAIGMVAVVALIMAYLIFTMVRRDSDRKSKNQKTSKTGSARSTRSDGWSGAGERRSERDSTVIRTTIDPTFGRTTVTQDSVTPPITVIQSQWKDIQANTQQKEPSLGVEIIEADANLKQSVEKAGYNPFYSMREDGIEVAEMGDDVPEAEVLMRMGFHDQAMQVLERMIADLEHPQPKIWLMLFELYKKIGQREKYNELGKGFNTYFNAVAPDWDLAHTDAAKNLEDYAGVINKVVRLWGLQGCRLYLESLLYDNRSGTRTGFSLAAYDDIIFLLDLIQTIKDIGDDASLTLAPNQS